MVGLMDFTLGVLCLIIQEWHIKVFLYGKSLNTVRLQLNISDTGIEMAGENKDEMLTHTAYTEGTLMPVHRGVMMSSSGSRNEELETLAYVEQGEHEMEFCTGDESDLLTKKTLCDKDSTHDDFISVADFHSGFLPERYRGNEGVCGLIQAATDVTVRIVVDSTSLDRPDGYNCHKLGGKFGLKRYGSGWVWSTSRTFSTRDNETCPCKECVSNKETAKRQWGQFIVRTAKHVIFDDFEAQNASFELTYDSEEFRGKCEKLLGAEVLMSDIDGDFSEVTCVTHDENQSRRLEDMVSRYRQLFYKLGSENEVADESGSHPVVIISHPHGCSKQISVGIISAERDDYPRNWTYTARTCPGSSGGPVLRLGKWSLLSCVPPHSGSRALRMNYSSEPWLF